MWAYVYMLEGGPEQLLNIVKKKLWFILKSFNEEIKKNNVKVTCKRKSDHIEGRKLMI